MLITNGEVGAPVRELTIASTLQRMLLDVAEVGADVDWLPMGAAGVTPRHPRRHDERRLIARTCPPMSIFHAFVLGLVQGLSEFLPISSSAHLLLVPWLFGWNDFDDKSVEKAFDVALHLGTLVAAVVYFRHELARYIQAGASVVVHRGRPVDPDGRIAWLLLLSTVPAAAIGAVFQDTIDEQLGTPTIIAVSIDRVRRAARPQPTA